MMAVQRHRPRCQAPRRSNSLGSVAGDQRLGLHSKSSCPPARWCLVPRGKPHTDIPLLSLYSEATLASSLSGLDVRHIGLSSFSVSSGRDTHTPLTPALPVPSLPQQRPSSPCTPHRYQGCQELMSIVRLLTIQLQAPQTEVDNIVRAASSPPLARPTPPSPTPARAATPTGADTLASSAGSLRSLSHPAAPPPTLLLPSWLHLSLSLLHGSL